MSTGIGCFPVPSSKNYFNKLKWAFHFFLGGGSPDQHFWNTWVGALKEFWTKNSGSLAKLWQLECGSASQIVSHTTCVETYWFWVLCGKTRQEIYRYCIGPLGKVQRLDPIYLISMQFLGQCDQVIGWSPPLVLPPPRKFWIRHCVNLLMS